MCLKITPLNIEEPVESRSCGYLSFFPIMASVLSYISPIYHSVSLLPNPSPHKSTIDLRHCCDECNLLSNDHQMLQMGAAKRKSFLIINYVFMLWYFRLFTSQTIQSTDMGPHEFRQK